RKEVELLRGAATEFDHTAFLGGRQTPVFFGSAINNFGVREILRALIDWAPEPQPRDGGPREVVPDEEAFSGFVFKIQANMDPMHRDRIAFFRVCSGRFTPGLKTRHQRLGREIKIPSAITFLAAGRAHREEAAPGDIIGIHNHGQFQIGDTLTQGEALSFKGIPYFAPELFRRAHLKEPLRSKQLHRGLKELGEEGAIQVFEPRQGAGLILGAVGALQFDIVAARLQTEYKVDAVFEPMRIHAARWVTSANRRKLADFCEANALRTATDVDGNLVFLADSRVNLELTQERWPDLQFHEIREHGERL
ncbi:MAG: peptide chain release factor 3, partial [Nitrococcus mobilis]|nr:peptide chain release factor 3 [Nitrococcus mobilis]